MNVAEGLAAVEAMEDAVRRGDRASVPHRLTEDVVHAVGARPPLQGVGAALAAIAAQGRLARRDGHELRGAWADGHALVAEVESRFARVADGRSIALPCADIHRFRDGRVRGWRVHADTSPFHEPDQASGPSNERETP